MPQLGFADVTPEIAAATDAARHASVAVVFAAVSQSEGVDRPNLYLPGDANALISSVAAVNRRTVVVLNSGGAVLMPWINRVAAVLEAWYPGQEDGTATAAVLDGQVDPSGHLPLTFPAVGNPSPVGTPRSIRASTERSTTPRAWTSAIAGIRPMRSSLSSRLDSG